MILQMGAVCLIAEKHCSLCYSALFCTCAQHQNGAEASKQILKLGLVEQAQVYRQRGIALQG